MDIEAHESLGEKVRRLRLAKKMSQKELADDFVTVSMISQVERGVKQPSVELLQHIAKKLQVPLHELAKMAAEQMETVWRHQLAKAYLVAKQPEEAVPLLLELRSRSDLSYATNIEVAVEYAECLYLQVQYADVLELLLPITEELEKAQYDDAYIVARFHYTIGNTYYQKQSYIDANYHYRSAYNLISRFALFDHLAARISYNTGITFQLTGSDRKAVYYLDKAYQYFKDRNNQYELAATMLAQGIAYKNMFDYSKAIECLSHARGMFLCLELRQESYDVLVTIASTVTMLEDPSLALEQLKECIPIYLETGSYTDLVLVYAKMAMIQIRLGNLDDAFRNLVIGESLMKEYSLVTTPSAGVCYQTLASYYFKRQENQKSIELALEAARIFDTIGLIADQVDSLQIACDAYHEMGDSTQAFMIERKCSTLLKQLNGRGSRML